MSESEHKQYTSTPQQWEKLKPHAREMRHVPTPHEQLLWDCLRNRRVNGAKFRRQHAMMGYIVDFVCVESRLIVEVDGAVHNQPEQKQYDQDRQAVLESLGYRTLRFTNDALEQSLDDVVDIIATALKKEV